MAVSDGEAERFAQEMIARHGTGAVRASVERLNEMIERRDWDGRDLWARVVHAIHQVQPNRSVATPGCTPGLPS